MSLCSLEHSVYIIYVPISTVNHCNKLTEMQVANNVDTFTVVTFSSHERTWQMVSLFALVGIKRWCDQVLGISLNSSEITFVLNG